MGFFAIGVQDLLVERERLLVLAHHANRTRDHPTTGTETAAVTTPPRGT
jgi:hypothetical protein